jgi:TonB family protein
VLTKVSLRIVTMPIQSQGIITRDNVSIDVAGVAYFRVVDAEKAVIAIEDVDASWRSLGGDPNLAFDEWRAMVRCKRGLGQFQLTYNTRPLQSQLIIHGTKSVLRVDLFAMFHGKRASTPLPLWAAPARPPESASLGAPTGSVTGSGALTLDVSDFPYAWYLRQVLQKVEQEWQRQNQPNDPQQKPQVYVEIQRDGSIKAPAIHKSSGNSYYDNAALRAVMAASPFPKLPDDWSKPSLRILFTFDVRRG